MWPFVTLPADSMALDEPERMSRPGVGTAVGRQTQTNSTPRHSCMDYWVSLVARRDYYRVSEPWGLAEP